MSDSSTQRFLPLDCFAVSGWHPAEIDRENRLFRWTGPEHISTIDLPVSLRANQRVLIHVPHQAMPDALAQCRLSINGHRIRMEGARPERAPAVISAAVPRWFFPCEGARLTIELRHVSSPTDSGHDAERRQLGIAVELIEFSDAVPSNGRPLADVARPDLSIVVPTAAAWLDVRETAEKMVAQARLIGAEIIVANGELESTWPSDVVGALKWISLPGADIFELRAAGVSAATGNIVAVTEDHCSPAPDWCAQIVALFAAHRSCVGAGGAVLNGTDRNFVDRANFSVTFSQYEPERLTASLPAISNLAIRRDYLPAQLNTGWLEFVFLPALAKIPGKVLLSPKMLVTHFQSYGWGVFANHFHNGRASGGLTASQLSSPRSYSATIHGLQHARRKIHLDRKQRSLAGHLAARVAARLLILAHAVGIAIGTKWGKGKSAELIH